MDTCIHKLQQVREGEGYPECNQLLYDIRNGLTQAMDDDLNVSAALAAVFSIVRRINRLNQAGRLSREDAAQLIDGFRQVDRVLAIFDFKPPAPDEDSAALIAARQAARAARDWDTADRLREELRARGVTVEDPKR